MCEGVLSIAYLLHVQIMAGMPSTANIRSSLGMMEAAEVELTMSTSGNLE